MKSYLLSIKIAFLTLTDGLSLTWKQLKKSSSSRKVLSILSSEYFDFQQGITTVQYPRETLPIPETGRYQLHNEIEDCIVCDKCAKVCPVDCIEIEAIKSTEEIGKTSDGSTKRLFAAKFDIDMSKCCFCGLCTTVCPTECLTMTPTYDFSSYDLSEHTFAFSEMTPLQIIEAKEKLKLSQQLKLEERTVQDIESQTVETAKPIFKPKIPISKPKMKE